jgi:primosomal protein N' (replication factor Y)
MARLSDRDRQQARKLRASKTDAEYRLWFYLRNKQLGGWRFRRQHPIPPYTVDFACVEARLAIELDGGQHAVSDVDRRRDARLRSLGWRVLRFWNNDVLTNAEGVQATILAALGPHPGPPPAKPGEETRLKSL